MIIQISIIIISAACVLITAIYILPVVFAFIPFEHVSYSKEEYSCQTDRNRLMPEIKDFNTNDISFSIYTHNQILADYSSYIAVASYSSNDYEKMKKSFEEKYKFCTDTIHYFSGKLEPGFEKDGFYFHMLSQEYDQVNIPNNVYICGFNDSEKQIAFIYFEDNDLDVIESYDDFMENYCGWKK